MPITVLDDIVNVMPWIVEEVAGAELDYISLTLLAP